MSQEPEGDASPLGGCSVWVSCMIRMAEIIGRLKGKGIVSLNDPPDIPRVFAGYPIETTDIRYTIGDGQGREVRDVVIFRWDVTAEMAGRFYNVRRKCR